MFLGAAAVLLAGCSSAKPSPTANERANADAAAKESAEAQSMAEAALGKQAEILERGDLSGNGSDEILVVNRIVDAHRSAPNSAAILVRRAAVLENRDGKWSEVLRCDEHLKNPNGYLAGTPAARVSGWQLEYRPDARQGLQMTFTPVDSDAAAPGSNASPAKGFVVRWNKAAKRYQSLDQSHERFLNEVPTLETPMSILK
jgi:hypothetical protein